MVLGALLLWLGLQNWRKPVSENQGEPRFFSIVDKITPPKAFGFGAMVSVINLKNLALFLTALSVVVLSDLLITEKIFDHFAGCAGILPVCDYPSYHLSYISQTRKRPAQFD